MFKYRPLLALLIALSSFPLAAEQLRDPTRPLREAAPSRVSEPALELNSILISQQRRLAVINGQTVAEGGHVGGAKVMRIFSDRVSLLRAGKPLELRLHSSVIRSDAG